MATRQHAPTGTAAPTRALVDVRATPSAPVAAWHGRGLASSVASRAPKILGTQRRQRKIGAHVPRKRAATACKGTEPLPPATCGLTGVVERPTPLSFRRPRAAVRSRTGGPLHARQALHAGGAGIAAGV